MKNSDYIDFDLMLKKFNVKHPSKDYVKNVYGLSKEDIKKNITNTEINFYLLESCVARQYNTLEDVRDRAGEMYKHWYVENGDMVALNELIYNRMFGEELE